MEYESKPDGRLVAVVLIAVIAVPGLIAAELAVPSLQPKFGVPTGGGGGPSPGGNPGGGSTKGVQVVMPNGVNLNHAQNFQPSTIILVIGVNNSITWLNQDSTDHTATFTSVPSGVTAGSISVGDIPPGSSVGPIAFTTPGTYQFHCQFHPGWMRGTVIVRTH